MRKYNYCTLSDGRKLSYMEFGKADGHPVFYFHGSPSSCFEPLLIGEEIFYKFGLRIISPNRPGVGMSDFQENRTFNDWPKDVISLAKHLQIDKFSIFGNSGGASYVVACAALIPERLISAVVISGGWQMNMKETKKNLKFPFNIFWFLARNFPFLLPTLLGTMKSSSTETKEKALEKAKKMSAPADFEALKIGDRFEVLSKSTDEAILNKKGAAWDLRLYLKKLEINLEQIAFPITFFHGELDRNMPIEVARLMTSKIPNTKLITYPGEAHLSMLCNHFVDAAEHLLQKGEGQ